MTPDTLYIKQVQSSSAYDYLSEIPVAAEQGQSVQYQPPHASADWIERLVDNSGVQIIAWVICALIIVVLIWMIIKNFEMSDDEATSDVGMGDDTIYGHDWEREIQQQMRDGRYGEAVVLSYLRCLWGMQQRGVIEFHQSKTPGMYLGEIEGINGDQEGSSDDTTRRGRPSPQEVERARVLTRQYLRVRYGHKDVDRATAERMIALSDEHENNQD